MRSLLLSLAALFIALPAAAQQAGGAQKCGLYAYWAEVTEVYDGDTITADIDLGFSVWRKDEKLRLWGIDAPEVRGSTRPDGLASRDALRARLLGKQVIICTVKDKTEKYGRYLAEIYLEGENINKWLLDNKFAKPYGDIVLGNAASLRGTQRLEPEYIALTPLN